MPKRIYVAGPLSADNPVDYIRNCRRMMQLSEELREMGYSPFIPCLDFLMGLQFGYDRVETYYELNFPWVSASDAIMLAPGWRKSKGTRLEIEEAFAHGIPVFESLSALDLHFKEEAK